ncbi:CAP domain-containing protein [Anaerosporobacter faecicola]|uniref:CAP domain-containing protein n=1 Tax=Anaerosporobacter faecicola TaxID=2718714 RepID=UPI001439E75F|nr:CAP domain-containing protein [Anaerosporobacter faecicola]
MSRYESRWNKLLKRFILVGVLCIVFAYIAGTAQQQGEWKAKAAVTVAKPTLRISQRTATTVTISIGSTADARGYRIYRATSKDGSYTAIGDTTKLTYKDTGRKSTSKYYYKVRAYRVINGKKIYSAYSNVAAVTSTLKQTTNVKVRNLGNTRVVSWGKVTNASKYNVYRATKKDGTFTYIGSSSSTQYRDDSAQGNKTYYYRVRAYRKATNIKYYGVYSSKIISAALSEEMDDSSQNNGNGTGNDSTTSSNASYTSEVLRLINIERKKEGLSSLSTTSILEKAAFTRAQEIKKSFSHTRPNGSSFSTILKELGISYQACGENIAYGQKTPEAVVNAWMNSSGHRANILSSNYNKVGIGCYIDSNNVVYWTQVFTN